MFYKNGREIRKNHQKIHGFRLVLTGPNTLYRIYLSMSIQHSNC
jgi:hypothetical protein